MVARIPQGLARQISNFDYHLEETPTPVSFPRIPEALRRQSPTTVPRTNFGNRIAQKTPPFAFYLTTKPLQPATTHLSSSTQFTRLPLLDHNVHSNSLQVGYLPAQMADHHPALRPRHGLRPRHPPHLHRPDIHLRRSKIHPCTGLLLPNV